MSASGLEIKRTESLTRQEVAQRLSALAHALTEGGDVEIQLGGTTLRMRVPDHVRSEFELELDGNEIELELELTWSTAKVDPPQSSPAPAKSAPARSGSSKSGSSRSGSPRSGSASAGN